MIESPSGPEPLDTLDAAMQAAFGGGRGRSVSVLEAVSRLSGVERPKVLLREESDSDSPAPVIDASARPDLPLPAGRGNYHVLGEIARGGMGAVLKAHDVDLGRDVAMKVLHPEHGSNASVLRRFVEEAQLGGQLQHPGIVPVYELGLMADERPYFTMKLVKGRTLAALLAARRDPAERRRHFLGVFEAVCRTVAYAHSRGVIHRDLKPANVMVGAFGEVQVMDWGLAKVLRAGGKGSRRGPDDSAVPELETVRSRSDSDGPDSIDGAVIGTPAYMSPEQARGEVEELDERADVLALGGMLGLILTGRTAYERGDGETLARAAGAVLGPIREALERCGAEEELVSLCRECLSPEPSSRPADAGVVAERLHAHLVSVEERARRAQVDAAEARALAVGERRVRRLTVGLAGTALVAVVAVGGGWAWIADQRAEERRERVASVDAALEDARVALAGGRWAVAESAAQRAGALSGDGDGEVALVDKASTARALEAEAAGKLQAAQLDEQNRAFLDALSEIRRPDGDEIYPTNWPAVDAATGELFRGYGLDPDGPSLESAVRALRARGRPAELAAALDEWSLVRREAKNAGGAERLSLLADQLDPDEERVRMRRAIRELDRETLRSSAARAGDLRVVATLRLLGRALAALDERDEAAGVYRVGLLRWPGEFTLHVDLARLLRDEDPVGAERHYTAALALRPESVVVRHELMVVLSITPRSSPEPGERLLALIHRSLELRSEDPHLITHLGYALLELGHREDAILAFERHLDLHPCAKIYYMMGVTHWWLKGPEQSVRCYREALHLDSDFALARYELGRTLLDRGEFEEAERHLRQAYELDFEGKESSSLLAQALHFLDRSDEAIAQCERALEHDDNAIVCGNFAWILTNAANPRHRDVERAEPFARRALELSPESAEARATLGVVLYRKGEWEEAADGLRQAFELRTGGGSWIGAWYGYYLAMALHRSGDRDAARERYESTHGDVEEVGVAYPDFARLRAEAAQVLGLEDAPGAGR